MLVLQFDEAFLYINLTSMLKIDNHFKCMAKWANDDGLIVFAV